MESGIVRSAIAGAALPTPPAPGPVDTAVKPELARARAVEAAGPARPAGLRRSDTVALNTLPPAVVEPSRPADGVGTAAGRDTGRPDRAHTPSADAVQRRFEIDDGTRQIIFRVIDVSNGEVVRQFPQENRLRLREMLRAFGAIPQAGRTALFDGSY